MSGGLTDDLLKAAGQGLIASAFKRLKLQLARRGAELKSPADYDGFEDLLNEALDVLAGSSGDKFGEGVVGFKAFLSKRPKAFEHEPYRRWIDDPRSRKLVKQAVYADARREDLTPILLELRDVFADVTGERSEAAERYVTDALSFVFMSLHRYLEESDQVVLGILGTKVDAVASEVKAVAPKVAEAVASKMIEALRENLGRSEAALAGRGQIDAIDRDLARRLAVAERRVGFPEASDVEAFLALGREAMQAGSGTNDVRRRVLLRATRAAAICGDRVEAEAFFAAAEVVPGPADETPARARVLEARGQVDEAIRLLRDRQDPDSLSTLMDIQRRARATDGCSSAKSKGCSYPTASRPTA